MHDNECYVKSTKKTAPYGPSPRWLGSSHEGPGARCCAWARAGGLGLGGACRSEGPGRDARRLAERSALRRLPARDQPRDRSVRRSGAWTTAARGARDAAARPSSPSKPADAARSCSSAEPGSHSLDLVRRTRAGWRRIPLARAPTGSKLGWPGLVLERGNAMVAFTRWRRSTHRTALMLVRIDRRGRAHSVQITGSGFPKSFVAPPAVPVLAGPHGSRDRVVRHRRRGRDDRVASAERHLEGPVHRRRVRRLPGRAAPWSGRRQRGVRSVDAGAPRRGRAARVARETRAVDRERLRARSRGHDRLRADPDRTGGCGERMGVRGRPRAHGRRRRLGRCRRREPPRRLRARRPARRPLLGPTRHSRRASGQARRPLVVPAAPRPARSTSISMRPSSSTGACS